MVGSRELVSRAAGEQQPSETGARGLGGTGFTSDEGREVQGARL